MWTDLSPNPEIQSDVTPQEFIRIHSKDDYKIRSTSYPLSYPTISAEAPITVSTTETIKAIAAASGYANSAVASAAYTITTATAATPTFSPAGGTYTTVQNVAIYDATQGAAIYYTTNGSTPSTKSTKYAGGFTVSSTETIQAIAVANGYNNSAVASAMYTINLPSASTPTFSQAAGTYTSPFYLTLSDTIPNSSIYYTTDGSTPTTSSTPYRGEPFLVSASETIKAIATAFGDNNSAVASATLTLSPDIESNILTSIYDGIGNGRMVLYILQDGTVIGSAAGAPQVQSGAGSFVEIPNPDSGDGSWDYAVSFVGGKRLQTTSNSFTDPFYVVNQPASGSVKVYAFTRTTVVDPSTDTVQTTVQLVNSVALPFTNNSDGSRPVISLVNT